MNWQKIHKSCEKSFSEFFRWGRFTCENEEELIDIIKSHGSIIMGVQLRELYDFFDERNIIVSIRSPFDNTESFQWKIGMSGWSTERFANRTKCEEKAFEIAFFEREKQLKKEL